MMSKRIIDVTVKNFCQDTNIEVLESFDWDDDDYDIVEFNLCDCLDDDKRFEADVNELVEYLEQMLDADIFIGKPTFEYLVDIDSNNNEIKYHCNLIIGKAC